MENSKEKQIEEMANIITDAMINGAENFVDCVVVAVEELVAKGYRKSTDIAEEIFAEIDELLSPYGSYIKTIDIHEYIELKKKYTESEKDNG